MKHFLRTALSLICVVGIAVALWPLGQTAYARWNQHALQTAWREKARHATSKPQHRNSVKPASQRKSKIDHSITVSGQPAAIRKAASQPEAEWPPTRIIIPEIDVDAVVLQGWDEDTLRRGPGHNPQTGLPGQPGNCVIASHRNVYGSYFRRLDALLPGSEIQLRTPEETFTYQVTMIYTIADTDGSVLQPPGGSDAPPRLTLITCTLPRSTSRVAVVAQLLPPSSE